MPYLYKRDLPRILLIDFNNAEVQRIIDQGYNVVRGVSGYGYRGQQQFLPAPHEKDIVFYDTTRQGIRRGEDEAPLEALLEYRTPPEFCQYFDKVVERGGWIVAFVGEKCKDTHLSVVGLNLNLSLITESTSFEIPNSMDKYDPLLAVFRRFKDTMRVLYCVGVDEALDKVSFSYELIWDELGRVGGRLISPYYRNGYYLILPDFGRNIEVVEMLLTEALPEISPGLFPGREEFAWLEEEWYAFPKVVAIKNKMLALWQKTEGKLKRQQQEMNSIETELRPFKQILIADDEHFEGNDKLSATVDHVLSFLGFDVQDVDQTVRKGKTKREDLRVEDKDGYFAICECTGTTGGPEEKFYSQLLKEKDLATRELKRADLRGLLVVNHFRQQDARQRPKLYAASPDIIESATEAGNGLLSTFELYKIAMAVMKRQLKKSEARRIVKQPGLIVFEPASANTGGNC